MKKNTRKLITLLTYLPPEAELFKDPTLQTYGYLF